MLDKAASSATGRALLAGILALVILVPVAYSVLALVAAWGADSPETSDSPERPDSTWTECIRDTEYMRFHHMDLLKQIREEFIRDGIRGNVSLQACRGCHPSRERFCDRCHEAASVILDCFGCHYYPEPGESQQLGTGGP